MDWMRQPKKSNFILIRGTTERVPVRWFVAPAGAALFPGWHHFGNCDWFPDDQRIDIGDYNNIPRTWQLIRDEPEYEGRSYCGDPDWFENGVPPGSRVLHSGRNHVPSCCLPEVCVRLRILGLTPPRHFPCERLLGSYDVGNPPRRVVDASFTLYWVPWKNAWHSDAFGDSALPFSLSIDGRTGTLLATCKESGGRSVIEPTTIGSLEPSNPSINYDYRDWLTGFCCLTRTPLTISFGGPCAMPGITFSATNLVDYSTYAKLGLGGSTSRPEKVSVAKLALSGSSVRPPIVSRAKLALSGSSVRPPIVSRAKLALSGGIGDPNTPSDSVGMLGISGTSTVEFIPAALFPVAMLGLSGSSSVTHEISLSPVASLGMSGSSSVTRGYNLSPVVSLSLSGSSAVEHDDSSTVSTGCCESPIPTTLYIRFTSDCAWMRSEPPIAMVYDPIDQTWKASGSFANCEDTYSFAMLCDGTDEFGWEMTATGGAGTVPCSLLFADCSTPNWSFDPGSAFTVCCPGGVTQISVTTS